MFKTLFFCTIGNCLYRATFYTLFTGNTMMRMVMEHIFLYLECAHWTLIYAFTALNAM